MYMCIVPPTDTAERKQHCTQSSVCLSCTTPTMRPSDHYMYMPLILHQGLEGIYCFDRVITFSTSKKSITKLKVNVTNGS